MKLLTKQILTIGLIVLILFVHVTPIYAEDVPQPPVAPVAPSAPQAPEPPTAPTAPVAPTSPVAPTAPAVPQPTHAEQQEEQKEEKKEKKKKEEEQNDTQHQTVSEPAQEVSGQNQGTTDGGNVGDTTIATGDANNTANVITTGNTNTSAGPSSSDSSGATVSNTGNGSGTTNSGSATVSNNDNTNQNNSAHVNTDLNQSSKTGENNSSSNVGNTSITTGDANVTGTVVTAVNTNVDGVAVSEFNIADDHVGDIVLDFGANCISGCVPASMSAQNTENGEGSENTSDIDSINNENTFQNNTADIGNNLTLVADTGKNTASRNTGGDTSITTGDANVEANILTFANNNIAGNVLLGVVNIFGDLIGDIILPDDPFATCSSCFANVNVSNTGNGDGSENNASVYQENNDNTFQQNDANIENNLVLNANTGNNDTSRNTGGNSTITTGDTDVTAQVLNIANTNILGGNMWLVIVNDAGKWIGKIMGAPEGSMFAGSGFQFNVNENGEVSATNNGNGTDSTNTASTSQTNNTTTTQTNTANVSNNLNLTANTGDNAASRNTGGNSNIVTGDAKIVANIVNFVNNNIAGNGKLLVTLVNVFGSWKGDLVTPGTKKEVKAPEPQPAVGGQQNPNSNNQNNNNSNNSNTANNSTVENVTPSSGVLGQNTNKKKSKISISTKSDSDGETVLGISDEEPLTLGTSINKGVSKHGIKINLAWFVFLIPLLPLSIFFIKKRAVLLHRFAHKQVV